MLETMNNKDIQLNNPYDFVENFEFFNQEPDEKYGGLEKEHIKRRHKEVDEDSDYYQFDDENTIVNRTKLEQELNIRAEADYHNRYYLGNGKYGFKQIKLKS